MNLYLICELSCEDPPISQRIYCARKRSDINDLGKDRQIQGLKFTGRPLWLAEHWSVSPEEVKGALQ